MPLEYTLRAKAAKSVFFETFNDIDIYVEDSEAGYEKIYRHIFSRVLAGRYKVHRVFPLGERTSVIDECRRQQGNMARPTLYVIDHDLNRLTGETLPQLHGLYVLPCYCIENVLVCENALLEILYEEDPERTRDELKDALHFSDWEAENTDPLVRLFVEYAICRLAAPDIRTVAYKVTKLQSSATGSVDISKVDARLRELEALTKSRVGSVQYNRIRQRVESNLAAASGPRHLSVSGKDYLLPLLFLRARQIVRLRSSTIVLKLRLSLKCDVAILQSAIRAVFPSDVPGIAGGLGIRKRIRGKLSKWFPKALCL